MKYRWKKTGEAGYDEMWRLYLILDDQRYPAVEITWYAHLKKWNVFVSGYVSDEKVHVEQMYQYLRDAKEDAMNYMKVWWVSGALQRMSAEDRWHWLQVSI